MGEQELSPKTDRKTGRLPVFLAVAAVAVLAAAGAFLWVLNNRVENLQTRLAGTERRAESAERNALQKADELNAVQSKLIATEGRVLEAERHTAELEASNRQAAVQVGQLREQSAASTAAAEQAALQKQQALASRQEALGELSQMRQRRQQELDRMQQALNRIAPTERTATGMVMRLADSTFRFDFDSAALGPENRETLSRVAGVLLASEGYRLFIDGHTDDIGTDTYNLGLSERRAASVRDYLVKAGVPADVITVKGFGKSNPLVNAKTREAREKNRRVEIGIVDTIINYQNTVATKQR